MSETIESMKNQLADLQDEKTNLVGQKKTAEAEMSEINTLFRTVKRFNPGQYQKILARQNDTKRLCTMLDSKLSEVKAKIYRVNSLIGSCAQDESSKKDKKESIRKDLVNLRDKYIEFGSDGTRVSSMRLMASNFAKELDSLLAKSHTY